VQIQLAVSEELFLDKQTTRKLAINYQHKYFSKRSWLHPALQTLPAYAIINIGENSMTPITYKYTSTKEYHDAFPCAYRQWRADSHCNLIHGYSFSMKFYFGTNDLDVRNWAADYGGLKELKKTLEDQFDHTLIVAADDPEMETYNLLVEKKMAKVVVLPRLGCEGLSDMLYKYVNGVYIPEMWGPGEAARLWCYRVEVRETQSNMAFREGHREWNEDLFA
jgi:6-pyruvoyltetrahydropterin/6-carboxytetrahydropterin synthase